MCVLCIGCLLRAGKQKDFDCEESENGGENAKCQSSKQMGSPGVTISELIKAVKGPCSVQDQNLFVFIVSNFH